MAIINCLREKHFLFCVLAWKCFVVYIISHNRTTKIFLWQSGLRLWAMGIISYNNVVSCIYNYHALEWKCFFFHGLAWKPFAVYIIRQTSLKVRLKTWFLKQKCFFCYSPNSSKFQISCYNRFDNAKIF